MTAIDADLGRTCSDGALEFCCREPRFGLDGEEGHPTVRAEHPRECSQPGELVTQSAQHIGVDHHINGVGAQREALGACRDEDDPLGEPVAFDSPLAD